MLPLASMLCGRNLLSNTIKLWPQAEMMLVLHNADTKLTQQSALVPRLFSWWIIFRKRLFLENFTNYHFRQLNANWISGQFFASRHSSQFFIAICKFCKFSFWNFWKSLFHTILLQLAVPILQFLKLYLIIFIGPRDQSLAMLVTHSLTDLFTSV